MPTNTIEGIVPIESGLDLFNGSIQVDGSQKAECKDKSSRAYAYREGGDEYIALIPSADEEDAQFFF